MGDFSIHSLALASPIWFRISYFLNFIRLLVQDSDPPLAKSQVYRPDSHLYRVLTQLLCLFQAQCPWELPLRTSSNRTSSNQYTHLRASAQAVPNLGAKVAYSLFPHLPDDFPVSR